MAGIFDGLRKAFGRDAPEAEEAEMDESEIVSYVLGELEKIREERRTLELQWVLNANFAGGNQYVDIRADEVRQLPKVREYMERGVYNRIAPLLETREANLAAVSYDMTVNPRTGELDDHDKAAVSTKLLRYIAEQTEYNKKKDTAISWAEITGTAFGVSWWDPSLGEEISREFTTGDIEGSVSLREGDVGFGLLSSYEVFPADLYTQEVQDQRYIITEQVMDAKEASGLYGVEISGEDIDTYSIMPVIGGASGYGCELTTYALTGAKKKDAVKVVTYYEKPSDLYPAGRMAIIAGGELVYYGAMPYDEIPIVAYKCKTVAGQFYGKSCIEQLIPLQRAYNACKNKIQDYINTVAANPLLVPEGTADVDDLAECGVEPGKIIPYRADRGTPSFLQYPTLPYEVRNEASQLAADMEYAAGVSQLMVTGAAPAGITSGTAIENLRNIDSTRMSVTAENIRTATLRAAKQWLSIYKKYASGYRALRISGAEDDASVFVWCSDDINSYDITFDTENELINSKENQKQNFLTAWSMGVFAENDGAISRDIRRRALAMLGVADGDMLTEDDLQRRSAKRENTYFLQGVMPEIGEYDDDEIHMDMHRKFALGSDYRSISKRNPNWAEVFKNHISEHEARLRERAAAMQSVIGQGQEAL